MSFAADDFNRADSTSGLGTTSTGGYSWTYPTGHLWGISIVTAITQYGTSLFPAFATINVAQQDQDVQAASYYANDFCGVVAKFADENNYVAFIQGGDGVVWPNIFLIQCVGGVQTVLDSSSLVTTTGQPFRLVITGNTAQCYCNGILQLTSAISSALATNTKCGLVHWQHSGGLNSHWDDFQATGSTPVPTGSVFDRSFSDSLAIGEATSKLAPIRLTLLDTPVFTDSLAQLVTHLTNSYNDVFAISETLHLNSLVKGIADAFGIIESLTFVGPRATRAFSDSFTISDSLTRFAYAITDSLTFVDVLDSPRYLKQIFTITDSLTFEKLKNPLIDTLTFTDAICVFGNVFKSFSDHLVLNDRFYTSNIDQPGDPTIPGTGFVIHAKYNKKFRDFFGFFEQLVAYGGMIPTDCGFVPNVFKGGGQLYDSFTYGEIFFAINPPVNKLFGDNIAYSENFNYGSQSGQGNTQNFPINDSLSVVMIKTRTLAQSLSFSDSLTNENVFYLETEDPLILEAEDGANLEA